MKEIRIPEKIKVIEKGTFAYCTSLVKVNLPEAIESIEVFAFFYTAIDSLIIPAATRIVGNDVFIGCSSLSYVEFKEGNQEIRIGYNYNFPNDGKGLFSKCPLKEIIMGRNVTYETGERFGYSPFYGITTLQKVTFTDIPIHIFDNEFMNCTSIKEINLGNNVEDIGKYAFSGCGKLEHLSFGTSLKNIGQDAFSDCSSLKEIYAAPTVPPTCGAQALDDVNKWECTLYVPKESIMAYKNSEQWREFFFIESHPYIDSITLPAIIDNSHYRVYDLSGRMILYTVDEKELKTLPCGLYIINGRKVHIGK